MVGVEMEDEMNVIGHDDEFVSFARYVDWYQVHLYVSIPITIQNTETRNACRPVDTVTNVKGSEVAHEGSSCHLWEREGRIVVRLMCPDPIDDMQEFAHHRHPHDFERVAARLETRGNPLHMGVPADGRDGAQVEDAPQPQAAMTIDLRFAMHPAA
jgi:hypothetical protein